MRGSSAGIVAAALGTCLAGGWAGGCTAPRHSYGPSVSAAGAPSNQEGRGRWEVVFPGGNTGPALASGPEASRLDYLLVREHSTVIEESLWPPPRVDSLNRLRRLFLRGDPGEVFYYRNPPVWHYPPHPYHVWGW